MTSHRRIRIGTRESALALYQANEVRSLLNWLQIENEIIPVISDGDQDLHTPLYEMGIQGIFTKSLDIALLQNRIDLAVHSTKDIPTKLATGLALQAALERGSVSDCLVLPAGKTTADLSGAKVIATSSLRRKCQWMARYAEHRTENLRGNVQTRLAKLDQSPWTGAIFAQAALERLGIISHHFISLDWMLPAPAQGAIGVVCRSDDDEVKNICASLHHQPTGVCIKAERDFMAALHGGCAVPIAAYARIEKDKLWFRGNVFSLDASRKCEVDMRVELDQAATVGSKAAQEILHKGALSIIQGFRSSF